MKSFFVTTIQVLCVAFVSLPLCSIGVVANETSGGVILNFNHAKTLTEDEIQRVSVLAHEAGIGKISSISTRPMGPSSNYVIVVREEAVAEEAFFKYRELLIGSEKLFFSDFRLKSKGKAKSQYKVIKDGFWELNTRTVKYFPFKSNGEEIEITLGKGLKHEDLLLIISAIEHNRFEFSDEQLRGETSEREWRWPSHISLSSASDIPGLELANFTLHYRKGSGSIFFFAWLMGDTLMITAYGSLVS